jgi:hypothetical protein
MMPAAQQNNWIGSVDVNEALLAGSDARNRKPLAKQIPAAIDINSTECQILCSRSSAGVKKVTWNTANKERMHKQRAIGLAISKSILRTSHAQPV